MALKHFFDTVYNDALDVTAGRPYGLYLHGQSDTDGARLAIEKITTGLDWRLAQDPVSSIGPLDDDRPRRPLGARRLPRRHPHPLSPNPHTGARHSVLICGNPAGVASSPVGRRRRPGVARKESVRVVGDVERFRREEMAKRSAGHQRPDERPNEVGGGCLDQIPRVLVVLDEGDGRCDVLSDDRTGRRIDVRVIRDLG